MTKILRIYKTTLLDSNFYVDLKQVNWEIRDSKILRVYKIAVRGFNFYVDVTYAGW